MKRQFFKDVMDFTESDISYCIQSGDIEQAILAVEYWRSIGEWSRVSRIVAEHHDQLPESCELYLAECDEIWSRPLGSDHIPMANKARCNAFIDTLRAPARHYFRKHGALNLKDQLQRQKIREYRKRAPDRNHLWDVLYAGTLRVKNSNHLDRVLELCLPAIRAGDDGLEEHELSSIALVIVFNASVAARNPEYMRKALGGLIGTGCLGYNDNSLLTFGNLLGALDQPYPCSKFEDMEATSTASHLSRILLAVWREERYDPLLPPLEEHLNSHPPLDPINSPDLYLSLTPLSYPMIARIDEGKLCELIRIKQGSLKDQDACGKRLAALCHAIDGVPSVGLGESETSRDLRELAESMHTFWGFRGLAHRIIRSEQSHLVPKALSYLSEAYSCSGWKSHGHDPLLLMVHGTEPLINRLEPVLKWAIELEGEKSFNQAMEDIVIPTIAELPDSEEDDYKYSEQAKALFYTCATHRFLKPTAARIEELGLGFSAMGIHQKLMEALENWMERWGEDQALHQSLHFQLTWTAESYLPPRQGIEQLSSKRHYFTSDAHLEEIDSLIEQLQDGLAESAKPAHNFMLFDASVPAGKRFPLGKATPRELLQLGSVCSYLEAPNGQSLLPYKQTQGWLTIERGGWPWLLKNLLQHRLLQIRPDGPQGSFEINEDGTLSWNPDEVDLAVNIEVEGKAGQSQSGILMTLPALLREHVLSMPPEELLYLWRSFVRSEAQEYFLRCLDYFDLPPAPVRGDEEVFESAEESFSLEELLNLTYNACRAAAGDQKAERRPLAHARNRARSMLKTRMKNAVEDGWEIGPGFRGELMPMPYVVKFFAETFIPLGEAVYEKRKPNLSSIEDAFLRLKLGA